MGAAGPPGQLATGGAGGTPVSPGRAPARRAVLRLSGPSYRLSLWQVAALWLVVRAWRGLVWACRRPRRLGVALSLLVICWLALTLGRWALPVVTLAAGLAAAFALLLGWQPGRLGLAPARNGWRRMTVYRRRWAKATSKAGLADGDDLPHLVGVTAEPEADVVRVRMLPNQVVEDWSKAAPRLAQTFGVRELRVRSVRGRVHEVELWALRGDPLRAVVPVPAPVDVVDLEAVPVGRREDGGTLTLPLLYSHLLVGGETGSGKGSVIWSLLCGIAPAIRDGHVKVWAIDPKGGVELAAGEPLFERFCHGGPEEVAKLLEEAVAGMRARAEWMRGRTRKFVPRQGRGALLVLVVDELASVTAYVNDPRLRKRIADALALLLAQGRAVGIVVVAATQDVRKETVGLRDLFPVRVALRAAEDEAADMLLGRGARARGALTDKIDPGTPGVGYVVVDGIPEPVRARLAWVDDEHIARLAEAYRPPLRLAPAPVPAGAAS